ncbi:glutamate racemase [uncultured Chitinophaga sp.]|uniref:glutamate racemase n=1 Tax=uncultured Chitinophaga sp. TaxID=339340 RepID=UPI0025CEB73F|nr:glutamate racemase [uncultured Chitinophaga sp.]
MYKQGPIGVFDSGYGGLTVMKELVKKLPQYDYIYLGDNARAPYGTRSFDTVYHYTLECVQHLFDMGCRLVVLACNTASAKALRSIQQNDLPRIDPDRRVLGVIRPTAEIVGNYSKSRKVGVMGTAGTIASESYPIEIEKFFPDITVHQQACPMWVPLVENNEWNDAGADYFIRKYIGQLLSRSPDIDTIVLGCTHYPLLLNKIKRFVPEGMTILSQGTIVAESLADYLQRHPEIEAVCSKNSTRTFYTTDAPEGFDKQASVFFDAPVTSKHLSL